MAEVLTWRRKRTAFLPLVCFFLFSASVSGKPKTELLQIGTGNNWDFYPSRWSDGSDHSLLPPAEKQGEEGAYQAFLTAEADDRCIFNFDGLPPDILADGRDTYDLIANQILQGVEIVDPVEEEFSTPGLLFEGEPGFLILGSC